MGTYIDTDGTVIYNTTTGDTFRFMASNVAFKNWTWHSKYLSTGTATQAKRLKNIYMHANKTLTDEDTLIYTDGSNDIAPIATSNAIGNYYREAFKPSNNKEFRNLIIKLEDISGDTELSSIGITYKRKPVK